MNDKRLSVKQNMIWNTAGSLVYMGCQWLLTILITWVSGYSIAGDFSTAISITNIVYGLSAYQMKTFQVSDYDNKYTTGTYVYSRIVTCVLGIVVCTGVVMVGNYTLWQQVVVVAYMLYKTTEAFFDVFSGVFQKFERMDRIGKSMIVRGILSTVLFTVAQVLFQNLVISILVMTAMSALYISIIDFKKVRQIESFHLDLSFYSLKMLLWQCLPLALYGIVSTAVCSLPRVFLEQFCGNEMLGYYSSVATPTVIIQMMSNYIFNPLVVIFTKYYFKKESKNFTTLLLKGLGSFLGIAAVAVVVSILFGEWGLTLIFGKSIAPYTYLLVPAVICSLLIGVVRFLGMILIVMQKRVLLLAINIGVLLLTLVLSFWWIPIWNMAAVNYVIIVALGAETVVMIVFVVICARLHFSNPDTALVEGEGLND